MENLTELVVNYKKSNNKKELETIFLLLKKLIANKAKFIYERKFYPLSLYHKCSACRNCKSNNCEKCDKCSCIKGTFNLRRNNLCEYEDVEQDLWLEILRIVKNFNVKKDFNTYLYACLWEWIPTFVTKNFVRSISDQSLYKKNEEGEIEEIVEETSKVTVEDLFDLCETEIEKQIMRILLKDNEISQEEIAEKLPISRQSIGRILIKLKKRLKNLSKN